MDLPDIIYEKSGRLAYLSLNRPEAMNVFTSQMMDSICTALKEAKEDSEINAIILKGEGEAFSSGGNIKDMHEGRLASWDMKHHLWDHVQRVVLCLEDIDKPVIASIDGPAFGGGFDLTLACDLRIASERATFCATFVRIGLAPGNGGAWFLPRLIGQSKALDILLTGRVVEADEALRIGLVDRVVPSEKLAEETQKYAMEIACWPMGSVRAIKRAVYNGFKSDLRGHLDYMSSQLALLTQTNEHREAVRKFVEKDG
ncbi:MAG: enoyl-CoA hydratase/isomerase family protein [Deltaproteobacteria bacterium]|nr:enoyl-CoA hydratase/isomerase family protein [Deltaproteobacteria bacterium]